MTEDKKPQRISPKAVLQGDIIQFHKHLARDGTPTADTHIGVVVDFLRDKQQKLMGFEVFPLKALPKEDWQPNDAHHYLIHRQKDLKAIDLDTDHNYRLQYKSYIIPNSGAYLNEDHKGGVQRVASMNDTTLFASILTYADRLEIGLGRFFNGSREAKQLQGKDRQTALQKITESHSVEQGRKLSIERERQDSYDSTVVSSTVKLDSSEPEKIRKRRANTLHNSAVIKDISVTDAALKGVISAETANALTTEFDKRRKKPLITLGQFYELAQDKPKAFKSLAKASGIDEETLRSAVTSAHAQFLTAMNAPHSKSIYDDVHTDYDENHQVIANE